jgi:hypothetical protein
MVFRRMAWCSSYLWNFSSHEIVSIRIVSVKLASSLNHFVPDCCLWKAIIIVLVVDLRWDQIRQKSKSVVYNFGIQEFWSAIMDCGQKSKILKSLNAV